MIANVFIIPYLQYSLVLGAKFVRVLLDNLSLISEPETVNSNNLNLIKHLTCGKFSKLKDLFLMDVHNIT